MNTAIRYSLYIAMLMSIVATSCHVQKHEDPSQLYKRHCGSCHLLPDPTSITQDIWDDHVLPNMAARLGLKYGAFNYNDGNSMMENAYIRLSNTYPETPLIDSISFQRIRDFIISHAPNTIAVDTTRIKRHQSLTQFEPRAYSLREGRRSGIAYVAYAEDQFKVGDVRGGLYAFDPEEEVSTIGKYRSPVVSSIRIGEDVYQTEIGYMNPSELSKGAVYKLAPNKETSLIAKELHRPVYTKIADLNNDGIDEIIICEYGHLTGSLSLLSQDENGQYQKTILLNVAGSIKVDLADMDKDGSLDIITLMAQGDEAIYIGYQKEALEFTMTKVINLPPQYGSSWYELIDMDRDGDQDIALVNGDNVDYSIFLKPYHGLRIYLNDGANNFEEAWFYPMYGATRIIAEDFDLDGDVDLITTAYFPDNHHNPTESCVYFENQSVDTFKFKTTVFPEAAHGRWLVMESADYDQDGDMDVVLGSFLLPDSQKEKEASDLWYQKNVDLMLLENLQN